MTDYVSDYWPGPAGAQSRPVDAGGKSEVPTSGTRRGAPTGTITAGQSGSTVGDDVTVSESGFRVRLAAAVTATRDYWTAPAVFTDRPASLAELAEYAKQAPWTHERTGLVRGLGVGYYRSFAYPYTVVSRYREWFAQRPLRLLALAGGVKLAALTGPGSWAVDHLVYPAAHLAGHIFL